MRVFVCYLFLYLVTNIFRGVMLILWVRCTRNKTISHYIIFYQLTMTHKMYYIYVLNRFIFSVFIFENVIISIR